MIRKSLAITAAAAAAIGGLAPSAQASLLTCHALSHSCDETIPLSSAIPTIPTSLLPTELNTTLTFDKADPNAFAGYTLTGFMLTFTGYAGNTGSVSNTGTGGSVTGQGSSTVNFSFSVGALDPLHSALASLALVVNAVGPLVGPEFAGQSTTFTSTVFSASAPTLTTSNAPLSALTGAGLTETVTITTLTLQGTTYGGSGGNDASSINTFAEPQVYVDYLYTKPPTLIPEPISVVLLGSAMLGMGLVRRRAR